MRALLGFLLLPAVAACTASGELGEEEKRTRIDEMYEGFRAEFPEVEEISVEELLQALDGEAPPIVVDVRTDEERAVSIIPGSISRQDFEARLADLEGRAIVTYCTIGYRSGFYADELRLRGWEVLNLKGSVLSWTHGGRPLESQGKPTRRVHVYGSKWNLAAADFEAVW